MSHIFRNFKQGRIIGGKTLLLTGVFCFLFLAGLNSGLSAQKYIPPGYGPGQTAEGFGWSLSAGYKKIEEDYYVTLTPLIELPLWSRLRIGLRIPLEILAWDQNPKQDTKVPSLRAGTYDDREDYLKLIAYIRYGTHLYFNPDDSFNWSFYYGEFRDGFIGHKTIIHRYISNYDPTIYRAGMMADINNSWGGLEVFQSDVRRKEVIGTRVYIRPIGMFYGIRDLLVAGGAPLPGRYVAMSLREQRNPRQNGGVFYQEGESGGSKGGSIGQARHSKIGEVNFEEDAEVKFVEQKDPKTGETRIRAIPVRKPNMKSRGEKKDPTSVTGGKGGKSGPEGKGGKTAGGDPEKKQPRKSQSPASRKAAARWGSTFWSRWAIGYTVVQDIDAPLSLEQDGSGNLVVDPDIKRPRPGKDETLTFIGMDTEMRLSPFRWLEFTPYIDMNKIKHLKNSEGLHIGLDMGFKLFGNFMKVRLRPEYREFTANYIPVYFNSYYAIERTVFVPEGSASNDGTLGSNSITKLAYLKTLPDDGSLTKGYYMEFILELKSLFVVELNYENYEGPNNSKVFAGLYVPVIGGFFLNGYYMKKGFDKFDQSFEMDNRSLMAGEVGMNLGSIFYVKLSLQRTWEFDPSSNAFKARDEQVINFGLSSGI